MLPQVGSTELLLIAVVALIVIGPKDLPLMLRKLGQFVGRLRAMADDFRSSLDDMARQSELDELRREVQSLRDGTPLELAAVTEPALTQPEPVTPQARRTSAAPRPRSTATRSPRARPAIKEVAS